MITLFELLKTAENDLKSADIENPRFDAMCILEDCFSITRADYYARQNEVADFIKAKKFKDMIEKRKKHLPLQYILGKWDFYNSSFYVGEGVLIPRPETEILADLAIKEIKKHNLKVCFDLCAGSGCIGLSIAKECPHTNVFMIEKHKDAMFYLEKNAKAFNLSNVHIVSYDVFNSYDESILPKPDIIVSNPPYILTSELLKLQTEVLFEPMTALDGGGDGLIFYRAIAELWLDKMEKKPKILLEVGENQALLVGDILKSRGYDIKIIKDTSTILRFVYAYNKMESDK